MSTIRDLRGGVVLRSALGALALFGAAVQSAATEQVVFRAMAISVDGDGIVEVSFDQGVFDPGSGVYHYFQDTPVDVISEATGEIVATLTGVDLWLNAGSSNSIELSFGVIAGRAETTFVVHSPIIRHRSVPANEARARASAWISVSDVDDNYAMLQGLGPPGTGVYSAYYNVDQQGEGPRFTNLVSFLYAGAGATVTGGQLDPPTGFRSIHEVVDSSHAVVAFTMTPNDDASATTLIELPGRSRECPGDVDADWDRDLSDLAELLRCFGTGDADPTYSLDADLDLDGRVDLADLTALLAVFGIQCP